MKLVLFDPSGGPNRSGGQPGLNAGLAYLAASVKKAGHQVKVIDLNNYPRSEQDIIRLVKDFEPQVAGISLKTATYNSGIWLAGLLKSNFRRIKIIAGGPHVTLYPDEITVENREIDFAVPGECEYVLPKMLDMLEKGKDISGFEKELPPELDDILWPDFTSHEDVDFSRFNYPLVTSRGCPYGCIFCSVGLVSGRKWRARSAESVVDELAEAKEKYSFREFDVLDDTFTQDPERAARICEIVLERKLDLVWSCPNGVRADKINKELLSLMKRAGCHTITYGVETADPEIFNSIRKGERLEDVERAIGLTREAGIRVGGYFIIGLPGDSFEKSLATLEYAKSIHLDWAHFNLLAPYPGTKVYEKIKKEGRILADFRDAQHFAAKVKPVFEMPGFSAHEMTEAFKAVHTKQKLYHLVLPPGLTPRQAKKEVRRLRFKYDREEHMADIRRDIADAVPSITALFRLAAFELKRPAKIMPPDAGDTKVEPGNQRLKVMLVNDIGGMAGGTEVVVEELARGLASMEHDVSVVYSSGIPAGDSPAKHIMVKGLGEVKPGPEMKKELEESIASVKPDIIHLHNVRNSKSVRIAHKAAPSVRTLHDHFSICPSLNKLFVNGARCDLKTGYPCVLRLLDGGCCLIGRRPAVLLRELNVKMSEIVESRKLEATLVTTPFMRDELEMNGFRNVHVVPLHADTLDFHQVNLNGHEPMILWAGRLVIPDKGPDRFLEALSWMRIKSKAVIAGDGPAMDDLKKQAARLKLTKQVEFVGEVPRPEVISLMDEASVVAVTSLWPEPMCMVGIEAMGRGKPVVAFDTGGISCWLKDRKNGYLVQPGNTRAMALRLERLLLSSRTRKQFGERGIQTVREGFKREVHLEQTVNLYRKAIKMRNSSTGP